jgi:hypothetical protein
MSAADALLHPAFREIQESQTIWRQTNQAIPFPLFYLNQSGAPMPAPLVENVPLMMVTESQPAPAPLIAVKAKPGLAESRVQAGLRIKEWKLKNPAQPKIKKPLPHPAISVAYQISKVPANGKFEKPRPDLLSVLPKFIR